MKLEEKIGVILRERKLTIATAESCTGGLIASRITDVPGASDYFLAGFITYSNFAKETLLSVPRGVIEGNGAVSDATVQHMAAGVRKIAQADLGLAVTGIAGPGGGTPQKPVGTVYIGLASEEALLIRKFSFQGNRADIKRLTSDEALRLAIDFLEGKRA